MTAKLGIVAGGGELPRRLIEACRGERREFFVLAFHDQTDPETVAGVPHAWCRLAAGGKALSLLRAHGVDELVRVAMPEGALGRVEPDAEAAADIAHGLRIARALGALDIGQAVVVQQGLVLGVEAIEGTDALIARCAGLRRDGPGGVLVKAAKPGQERRIDLPAIGARTVAAAAAAGLRGIAAEAGGALLLDRDEVVRRADAAGLFVVGVR